MKRLVSIALTIALITITLNISCGKKPEQIKIGCILPLTGEGAKYGESAKRGIDLAIKETNDAGGVRNKKIIVIYEDNQGGDPQKSILALNKLITIDKVQAVIGPLGSSPVLAVSPTAEKNKVVILSPTATAPTITDAGDYIFRNAASDIYEGISMADFVYQELKYKKAAIIYINNDYGIGLRDAFQKEFEQQGGSVLISESFEQNSTDFRTQLTKIKKVQPEFIYMVGYKEMGRILSQAKELDIKAPFVSCVMFEDPEILRIAREKAEGVYYSYRAYDPNSEEDTVNKFVENYISIYKTAPDIFAALSYDAARIIVQSMKRGGFEAENIKNNLYTIQDFPGVAGKISFDKNGDVLGTMSIKVVRNGKFVWFKNP